MFLKLKLWLPEMPPEEFRDKEFTVFEQVLDKIEKQRVVPVVVIDNSERAVPLAKAVYLGGINCIEVTFRTPAAEESIKLIHNALPDMLVGAGTVINTEQAQKAISAGASFIVSPGFDPEIVKWCSDRNIPVIPGVSTASEVQIAVKMGLKVLKFFPAEVAGGVKMIKSLCGPFPMVKFMATGGISLENIGEYAACSHIAAIGGSWMVKASLINEENWEAISGACNEAVENMRI